MKPLKYTFQLFFLATMITALFACGPIKVKSGFIATPRFYCGVQTGQEWGLKNFKNATDDQYQFKPQELKSPIFNTIIANGWNVRFDLF